MRRFGLSLLVLLCMMSSALLSGCGGIVPIVPPVEPPDVPEPVYDGEPTQLLVKLEYSDSTRAIFRDSETTDTAYVDVVKTDINTGLVVYRAMREEPLPAGQSEIVLPFEVPAEQGYVVTARAYRGDVLLAVSAPTPVDAPALTITTATVPLVEPSIAVEPPDALYSGGDLSQFRIATAPEGVKLGRRLFYGWSAWDTNPNPWHLPPGVMAHSSGPTYLPTVTEPQRLYYQVALISAMELPDGDWHYAYTYAPDLSAPDADLPFIWCYPDPSWTE